MAYRHGIYVSEVPTSLIPAIASDASLPFVVGVAPVHQLENPDAVINAPVLINSYSEFVEKFGYVGPTEQNGEFKSYRYTLCEFADVYFRMYGAKPFVALNIGGVNTVAVSDYPAEVIDGVAVIDSDPGAGAIRSTIVVKSTDEEDPTTYVLGVDYEVIYSNRGYAEIHAIDGGALADGSILISFDSVDYSVDLDEVIGGIDPVTHTPTGLEAVDVVSAKFGKIPGMIVIPRYSGSSDVAAAMETKAQSLSGGTYKCMAVIEAPMMPDYTAVPEAKKLSGITSPYQIVVYPAFTQGGVVYSSASHFAGLTARTDAQNDDVPYVSPSNKQLKIDGLAVMGDDGFKPLYLTQEQATFLNGNGIVAAINTDAGWVLWGNRTAAYPGTSDPKESFIPVRRMFNWVGNTLVRTFFNRLDFPLNIRQVQTILDSANTWLAGLVARGYLLGGRVEFLESENPNTDLMDGIARFHVYLTPPSPNREIDFILEYDPAYLQGLFPE